MKLLKLVIEFKIIQNQYQLSKSEYWSVAKNKEELKKKYLKKNNNFFFKIFGTG